MRVPAPVRAVIFDYGHTLVDFTLAEEALLPVYEAVRGLLAALATRELPQAEDLVQHVSRWIEEQVAASYRRRELEEMDVVALYCQALGTLGLQVPPDLARRIAEMEHRAGTESIVATPETLATLEELRGRGLRLGLVSNAHYLPDLMREDIERLGIAPLIDDAVFSAEIGVRKPHPAIFGKVLHALGVEPEEAMFVGDRLYDDIRGAQSLGMRGVLTHEFRNEPVKPEMAIPFALIDRLEEVTSVVDTLLSSHHG